STYMWPGGTSVPSDASEPASTTSSPSTKRTTSPGTPTTRFTSQKSSRWGWGKNTIWPRRGSRSLRARRRSPGISAGDIDISATTNLLMFVEPGDGVWCGGETDRRLHVPLTDRRSCALRPVLRRVRPRPGQDRGHVGPEVGSEVPRDRRRGVPDPGDQDQGGTCRARQAPRDGAVGRLL